MVDFNEKYDKDSFHWGSRPHDFIIQASRMLEEGKVLDLGAGEGRDSLYLDNNGFEVTAVDKAEKGLEKIKEKSDSIRTVNEDITDFSFDQKYDIIISMSTLHFLGNPDEIIDKIKENTKKGGLNIISGFTKYNNGNFTYSFDPGELYEKYEDWNIKEYKEYLTPVEQHGDGPEHRHFIAETIAQKPQ